MIQGLNSESGKLLNDQVAQVMCCDGPSARICVRINPSDPKREWKKIKVENIISLTTEDLCASYRKLDENNVQRSAPALVEALLHASSELDGILKRILELRGCWDEELQLWWDEEWQNITKIRRGFMGEPGINVPTDVHEFFRTSSFSNFERQYLTEVRGYDLEADQLRIRLFESTKTVLQQILRNIGILVLHMQSSKARLETLVIKSKGLANAFRRFNSLLDEDANMGNMGICAILLDMRDEVPSHVVSSIDEVFDEVCESLSTELVLQKCLKVVPFGLSWSSAKEHRAMGDKSIELDMSSTEKHEENAAIAGQFEPEASVIQEIDHGEEEAVTNEAISPEEASTVADTLWASQVDHRIAVGQVAQAEGDIEDDASKMVLLTFSRNPQELETAILNSQLALQKEQEGVGLKPAWANGAKVLHEGMQPEHLNFLSEPLRPWHVIVAEKDEPSLLASLQHLPYVIRKLRPSGRAVVPDHLSLLNVSSGAASSSSSSWMSTDLVQDETSQVIEYKVSRTFIHFQESFDTRTVRTV